jgi:hypothetical protein
MKKNGITAGNEYDQAFTSWHLSMKKMKGNKTMITKLINDLIAIYNTANNAKATFASQGQAMDGYAELHGYRETIKKIIALDKEILSLDQLAEIQGVKPMTDEQLQESLKHFPDLSEFEKPRNDES